MKNTDSKRGSLTSQDKCKEKCYHQSMKQYDEYENGDTGEIISADYEVCKDCKAIIMNDKIVGYFS